MTLKTLYIRLLSYENACKVIEFISQNDANDMANITAGGVRIDIQDKNENTISDFLKSLGVRYEIDSESPYRTEKEIVNQLKIMREIG